MFVNSLQPAPARRPLPHGRGALYGRGGSLPFRVGLGRLVADDGVDGLLLGLQSLALAGLRSDHHERGLVHVCHQLIAWQEACLHALDALIDIFEVSHRGGLQRGEELTERAELYAMSFAEVAHGDIHECVDYSLDVRTGDGGGSGDLSGEHIYGVCLLLDDVGGDLLRTSANVGRDVWRILRRKLGLVMPPRGLRLSLVADLYFVSCQPFRLASSPAELLCSPRGAKGGPILRGGQFLEGPSCPNASWCIRDYIKVYWCLHRGVLRRRCCSFLFALQRYGAGIAVHE